jgi:beta-glucosidase/6-phospho-beta-glucosidase/beta-galactosidase
MFKSFYMAGFECATGRNRHGEWIDQVAATEHDRFTDDDYAMLAARGIRTVREGVRWPLVDRGTAWDFSSLDSLVAAAKRHEVEVIWDLFHFGYPERLDPFRPEFARAFARYAGAVARHLRAELPPPHYFTVVNEGSYFAWAAGEVARFAPHARGRGYELKVNLARAAIQAVRAIRAAVPHARFVTVDPICNVVLPSGAAPRAREHAEHFNHVVVFQFMDMLAGRLHPELGGSRDCLDIVGINYYATNQWELEQDDQPLDHRDPRRVRIAELVRRVARRYEGPVLLSETGDCDERRTAWLEGLSATALELLEEGCDFRGVCLYPILGMPEWHERSCWARMGLWDLEPSDGRLARVPYAPALQALARAQLELERHWAGARGVASAM